ncbi:MAG TPA: adenylosuccinate lyase family protein [Streptosporangiaceae bacterium]|jgi:3-carboxy-cis,cis-muconate cycloisomerase
MGNEYGSGTGGLFGAVFGRGEAAAGTGDAAWLAALLDVEAALSRAAARAGLVETEAAEAVTRAVQSETFDADELGRQALAAGNPVVPLVRALVGALPPEATHAVHNGATSQDILDTAAMLIVKRALPPLLADLDAVCDAAAELADAHRATLMSGRTLLQQALPTTFGLTAANWLTGADRVRAKVARMGERLPVQYGGAAGTMAAVGADGPRLAALLAEELGLAEPLLPWHTIRLNIVEPAAALAETGSVLGKIARDVTLLAQGEIAEVHEGGGPDRGGSSAMPQKRNPVASVSILACTRRVPGLMATLYASGEQEFQRAAGAWHAEWEPLSDLVRLTGSAAAWARDLFDGMHVDTDRMRDNLNATGGLPLAERLTALLAPELGRLAAHDLVRRAGARVTADGTPLREAIWEDAEARDALRRGGKGLADVAETLDPAEYLGATEVLIDRALAAHKHRDVNYDPD